MTVAEAKELVVHGIRNDLGSMADRLLDHHSPDPTDPGKFLLAGRAARVVHHFSGWHVKINLSWFAGSYDMPRIQRHEFYWYVFAIPKHNRVYSDHYLICDFLQLREWVLEFAAPRGKTHRNHDDWLANIHLDLRAGDQSQAYFRWGDEPLGVWMYPSRIVRLDNASVIAHEEIIKKAGGHIGSFGLGGESEAHRRLKLFVSHRPNLFGLSAQAESEVEHSFVTGDRVDVLFRNHGPLRTVVEVELDQPSGILVGVHQAIKYRSLAASESSLGINSPDVRAVVASFADGGDDVHSLAQAYDIGLRTVDRQEVLAPRM